MKNIGLLVSLFFFCVSVSAQRQIINFNKGWRFFLGDTTIAKEPAFSDAKWRSLDLPHDWSIEGEFSEKHNTTFNQGALPAGIGWYRKTFKLPQTTINQKIYINFDGVYRNSEVWVNGHYIDKRPNGYISFRYDITPHVKSGKEKNTIAVRVDNSLQPSSRWYTGSGIYRKVWLEITNHLAVDHWGVFVTTPQVDEKSAVVRIQYEIRNTTVTRQRVKMIHEIFDGAGRLVESVKPSEEVLITNPTAKGVAEVEITNPELWSVEKPYLYSVVTKIFQRGKLVDSYKTAFGIRTFRFDPLKGFFLNNKPLKILGVCNHHDLGALGAAFNTRAAERQLEMLKAMGCNAIRTAHNPPAPELLELCDKMGFLVMDEAFDMWKKRKNRFDYNIDFEEWHKRDLEDMVRRDRNHPSIIAWSIGNEIREQFDSTGTTLTRELTKIVKDLDTTRPVTCALTENVPEKNFIYRSG
ncbi:MAG: glycoside hydrolase family 2 protein, partial [Chitinophagaceae bacterium]